MPEYPSGENRLFYDKAGTGSIPVIFIHGFLASSKMWRDYGYIDALPPTFCSYAPDMRGHGKSCKVPGCDLVHMAEDVVSLIKYLNLEKPIVVGMSMSGGVGLKLLMDHPDLLRGLVLISPGFGSPLTGIKRLMYPLVPYAAQNKFLLKPMLKSAFVKQPPEDIVDGLLEDAMKVDRNTWRQFMHPSNVLDSSYKFGQITIPACFIFGEKDRAIPPKLQHRMADSIPTAKKVAYPDEGHGVVAENSDQVMKDMVMFFDTLQF